MEDPTLGDARRAIIFGAIGAAIITAIVLTRFDGNLGVLLATPVFFGLSTLLAEGVIRFKHGTSFGEHPGIGGGGWLLLSFAAIALFFSFVT